MEAHQKDLNLSDEQKSITSNDHLRHTLNNHQLQQVDESLQDVNIETNIQVKYYHQFKKIYLTSFKLASEIKKQNKLKEILTNKINQIDTQLVALHKCKKHEQPEDDHEEGENDSKRKLNKRTRRTAEEIQRKYYCNAQFCDRCYGSQGSLQQHIKLKHPQLYKRQHGSQDLE